MSLESESRRPGRTLIGRLPGSGQPATLQVRNGRIAAIQPVDAAGQTQWWFVPGLLDAQVNGFAGVDFQAADLDAQKLAHAVRELARAGCTRFLLTLVTDGWEALLTKLRRLRALRDESASLRAAIAGWHIEGPFLSSEPGFHGAHDPAFMLDPTPEHVHALRAAAGGDLVLLTLAPERTGALAAIKLATRLGFIVSLGHTNASTAVLREAVAAGATGFTHLGNACPQLLDRHDNILWRALETPGLTASLIADKLHVSPPLFRFVHRLLPPERILYITDAMAAAGSPPGRYRLGAMELEVGQDRVVRQPGKSNFAGSTLTPVEAVFNAAQMLGVPWQEAWLRMSTGPAKWLGLPAGLEVGAPADFCLVKATPDGALAQLRTFQAGQEIT